MKKSLILVLALSVVVIIGLQQAGADGRPGFAAGGCGCGRGQVQLNNMDAESQAKYRAFLGETRELRRRIAEKRYQQRSLMFAPDSDVDAVAKLTEEIGHLQDELQKKAREKGLDITTGAIACGGPAGRGPGPMGRGLMRQQIN